MDVDSSLKAINVKDDIKDIRKIHIKKKKMLTTFVLAAGLIIAIGISSMSKNENKNIVTRPAYGVGEVEYEVVANVDGKPTKISMEIKQKKLTHTDVVEILDQSIDKLPELILGENVSADSISSNLELIKDIGEYGVSVNWNIDKSEFIDFDGTIHNDDVGEEGEIILLGATLTLENESRQASIPIKLVQSKSANTIEKKIQDFVNDDENINKESVRLPDRVDGHQLTYDSDSKNILFLSIFLVAVMGAIVYKEYDSRIMKQGEVRNNQLVVDYPIIVSKLTLFTQAGLSIHESIKRLVKEYEEQGGFRYAYEELKFVLSKISNGMSQEEAYNQFGIRCNLRCYMKLGELMSMNLKRGSKEMASLLLQEVTNGYDERKAMTIKMAGEASTKLLLPMVIMLMIVIAIVIIPAFMEINF